MRNILMATSLLAVLAACDSSGTNPFDDPTDPDTGEEEPVDDGDPVDSDRVLPPGTASPTPGSTIFRREAQDADSGNGYATDFAYDSATDTFTVDGLAFDGDNTYERDDQVGSLGPYAVYEADSTVTDSFDGDVVSQFSYKALYGVSQNQGRTEFAIVRTGAYAGYGFGGFIYQRNEGVTLPDQGQAVYRGDYAGLRDFDGAGGIQYVTGDAEIGIDFEDFNDGSGVYGVVDNRRIFDTSGNDVTNDVLVAINTEYDSSLTVLPSLLFAVGPGVLDANGEMVGELFSDFTSNTGTAVRFESGNFYALVAGDDAEEIVGVIVVEGTVGDVTARETGGFIVYR